MKNLIAGIELSNPQKIVYDSNKITKYQVAKYYEDVSELMKDYGFKPSTSIEEGLSRFAEWFLKYYTK